MSKLSMISVQLERMPNIVLALHHPLHAPTNEDWAQFCAVCEAAVNQTALGVTTGSTLVFNDGPGPNPAQRKQIVAIVERGKLEARGAIVSTNAMVRGIVTAFNWLGLKSLRSFSPTAWREAVTFVGLTQAAHVAEARRVVLQLAQRFALDPRELPSLAPFARSA